MDLQAEKLELVQAILDIEDISVVKKVKALLKKKEHDWFDDLSEEQQEAIDRSIENLDKGERIPHAEVAARFRL